jgi:hypothetical protein
VAQRLESTSLRHPSVIPISQAAAARIANGNMWQGPGKVLVRPPFVPMAHVVARRHATALVQAWRQIPATGMFGHLVQTATYRALGGQPTAGFFTKEVERMRPTGTRTGSRSTSGGSSRHRRRT